jgi:hypothetical protein
MRHFLIIAVSALILSGCIAQWPSNRTGPRFHDDTGLAPYYDGGLTPPTAPTPPPASGH